MGAIARNVVSETAAFGCRLQMLRNLRDHLVGSKGNGNWSNEAKSAESTARLCRDQQRPALVISSTHYNAARGDLVLVAISSHARSMAKAEVDAEFSHFRTPSGIKQFSETRG